MSAATVALGGFLLAVATGVGGYVYGHGNGVLAESAKRDGQAVQQLTQLITAHQDLVKQSGSASRAMRTALATRAQHDDQTTREFRDALASTSDSRAGCVFPAGVMRDLATARDRAAQASASGIKGTVPGAAASPSPER